MKPSSRRTEQNNSLNYKGENFMINNRYCNAQTLKKIMQEDYGQKKKELMLQKINHQIKTKKVESPGNR